MTHNDIHAPTPAFRTSLEAQLVSAYRAGNRSEPRSRLARLFRTPRWRTAVATAAGLLLGFGVEFAAGQVAEARQRSEVVATLTSQRELTALKLELVRAELQLTRRKFDTGVISQVSLLAAESAFRAQEAALTRIDLDLEEARLTSASPRDELWAPLVGSRDFVKERLRVEAQAKNQQITAAEAAVQEAQRGVQTGALAQTRLNELQIALTNARDDLDQVAEREILRRDCLEKHLTPDDVTRRLQRIGLEHDVRRARWALGLAQERWANVMEQFRRGMLSELDVKKSEVENLERRLQLEQLLAQQKAFEARSKQH
jgi:hypothetical protein